MTKLADRYAILKEHIDELEKQLKSLREEILATGAEKIFGDKAMILVKLQDRTTVDWRAGAEKYLDPDTRELIASEFKKTTQNIATLAIKPNL